MISLRAFAKINLYLEVLGRREDGYHEIESVMQSVSLSDLVTLEKIGSGIEIVSSELRIPKDRQNTAYKAAQIFFDKTGVTVGVRIGIEKNIPIAAGLAGGSADAAAVLSGLNQLYKTELTESDLLALAAEVGSDVSFCLVGGTCRCRGRGELIEKMEALGPTWIVLVKPEFGVSTKWVYDNFDAAPKAEAERPPATGIHLYNDLEKVVVPKYPEVGEIKKKLVQLGCMQSEMSGSGPTVFGISSDEQSARKAYLEMKKKYSQSFLVQAVNAGLSAV
jgi:4-diphosphocytidyl-2-C-methyl-D-erythritol kinase